MRKFLVVLTIVAAMISAADAQVSVRASVPGLSLGINLPAYPQLVPVPGYPVYYAPQVDANYFFYDGMYWLYDGVNWYGSSWYNGPWQIVSPDAVPLYVLRVPVRYYRQPPVYFRSWRVDAPPRWGEHWGRVWEDHHRGWDHWDHHSVPARAPLPVYQRQYRGDQYPRAEQQRDLHERSYVYQPRDNVVREHYQAERIRGEHAPGGDGRGPGRPERASTQREAADAHRDQSAHRPVPNPAPQPTPQGTSGGERHGGDTRSHDQNVHGEGHGHDAPRNEGR